MDTVEVARLFGSQAAHATADQDWHPTSNASWLGAARRRLTSNHAKQHGQELAMTDQIGTCRSVDMRDIRLVASGPVAASVRRDLRSPTVVRCHRVGSSSLA